MASMAPVGDMAGNGGLAALDISRNKYDGSPCGVTGLNDQ
jgi:hypothetical protein